MRYPVDEQADSSLPYGETMHTMITLSMTLSIVIGVLLLVAGRFGKVLWLQVWSAALIVCSVGYLIGDFYNWI